jgi:thiol:disulfide interchange protein DsbD
MSPALQEALQANANTQAQTNQAPAPSSLGLLAALFGALLGGLLLNLMPCVFPVLAIKMLGFVNTQERRVRVQSGVAYTAGALLSFVALGGLLLALRAAGEQLGWGFQLQNPVVVAALAALFTLIGLNLAGVFEVGHLLPSRLASLEARHPAADAFLSGVLAVAVASPCTAPFMGASLGLALALPTWQALAVFAALGLGMALPYLAASLAPGVARWMPRPGVWMLRLKQVLAFPMFATVVWLVWVLGQQSGINGAAALLGLLLLLALLMWSLSLTGRSRSVGAGLSVLACAWGLSWALPLLHALPPSATPAPQAGELWQAWSPERMQELQAQGRPVLVDFTAAWCVTCQFNKKNALQDEGFLADVRARQVLLLRADWTRRDPQVTAALRALGRSGVPVYALYVPGKPPVLLSEILSAGELRQALAQL